VSLARAADGRFEETLQSKFGSEKRFGLEGCETLISGLPSHYLPPSVTPSHHHPLSFSLSLSLSSSPLPPPRIPLLPCLKPGLRTLVEREAAPMGVELIVFGMAHRGRLNVLHNVLRKPFEVIMKEFKSTLAPDDEVPHTGFADFRAPET
jgi:2-oxoglutarate dehydrogenase complex dehydrogenase (E1) component-like enzyme